MASAADMYDVICKVHAQQQHTGYMHQLPAQLGCTSRMAYTVTSKRQQLRAVHAFCMSN